MAEQTAATVKRTDRAGKYLTFMLAEEEYGLEILKVREIIAAMDITSIPKTPEFVKGVINLRGKVIAAIDLRLKFGMDEKDHTGETCIIVVNFGDVEMGVIVDRVCEVLDIAAGQIEDAPAFGAEVEADFILGMGKTAGRVIILLDLDKVLSQADVSVVNAVDIGAGDGPES